MIITIRKVVLLLVLFVPALAYGSEQALNDFLKNVATLEARFEQKISDESGRLIEKSRGVLYLSRPDRFRWDYLFDENTLEQQIIADGQSIYFYDPDLEQVTMRDYQDALLQVPSLILVRNNQDVAKHFVVETISADDGLSWVSLLPRVEDAGYQRLLLGFNNDALTEILLFDLLGNETHLQLYDIVLNDKLADDAFDLNVPEGTDVLQQ